MREIPCTCDAGAESWSTSISRSFGILAIAACTLDSIRERHTTSMTGGVWSESSCLALSVLSHGVLSIHEQKRAANRTAINVLLSNGPLSLASQHAPDRITISKIIIDAVHHGLDFQLGPI